MVRGTRTVSSKLRIFSTAPDRERDTRITSIVINEPSQIFFRGAPPIAGYVTVGRIWNLQSHARYNLTREDSRGLERKKILSFFFFYIYSTAIRRTDRWLNNAPRELEEKKIYRRKFFFKVQRPCTRFFVSSVSNCE